MRDIRTLASDRVLVSPSILAADFTRLGEEVARVTQAGADVLHLDVMDGHMVPNISFGPPIIKSLRPTSDLIFDTHLMISDPLRYAEAFAGAGADHLTFHLECGAPIAETIAEIRRVGCTVGISLKPGTPAEALFPWLDKIDLVLVMTVEPGFGGQSFMADMMSKTAAIRQEIVRRNLHVCLEVDGGVDENTVVTCARHGARLMVAGTSVFRHKEGAGVAIARLHAASVELDRDLN